MKKNRLFSTLVVGAMSLALCAGCCHNAIVTVNGECITKSQYDKAFSAVAGNPMFAQMGIDVKKDENSFVHLMLKERIINELVVKKLIDQEIKKKHIKVSKEDMDNQLKVIIDKVGSKEKFNKLLKENGVSTAQVKADLEEEVKIQKLVDSLAVVSISDKEALKFYNDNKDKFKVSDRVKASHILVKSNEEETRVLISESENGKNMTEKELDEAVKKDIAEKKAKAEKLLAEVKKDPSKFAQIAKENSDDVVSAQQGGDLGFFEKNDMVEPFANKAFSMKPNTISDIVVTPYGYHIILVTDRQKAGYEPFDKVKTEIKEFLTNQEKVKTLQQYVDTLKNNAKVEYKDDSFNPENIKKKLREQQQYNPAMMGVPAPAPAKK